VDRLGDPVEADDDLGGAERRKSLTPLEPADRGHHVRACARGELHREPPDPARGTGDQHPAPHQRAQPPQRS
jgi:hypothetical protein